MKRIDGRIELSMEEYADSLDEMNDIRKAKKSVELSRLELKTLIEDGLLIENKL